MILQSLNTAIKDHSTLTNLGWSASGHTIAADEKVYFGDSGNGDYFTYESAADEWRFYRNNVLVFGF
jgi:hypothetical protein